MDHVKAFAHVAESERRKRFRLTQLINRTSDCHDPSSVRRSLLRGDSDVIERAGNAVRPHSSRISRGPRHPRAPWKPHNKSTSRNPVISWRMKRPVYAPTTASSSPSRNRYKTHRLSSNATRRHKTSVLFLPRQPLG